MLITRDLVRRQDGVLRDSARRAASEYLRAAPGLLARVGEEPSPAMRTGRRRARLPRGHARRQPGPDALRQP